MSMPNNIRAKLGDVLSTAPVDVYTAAKILGTQIIETRLDPKISGALLRIDQPATESGFVVYVSEKEPTVRQRFTAAHELGHLVLHREHIGEGIYDNYLLRVDGLSNRLEVEANKFAADLLMPFDLILTEMDKGHTTPDKLAKIFQVSKVAMSIRLGLPT